MAVGCRGEQPRVSGEKIRQVCCQRGSQGTTPHTRGKHRDRVLLHLDPRNNPARAGKSLGFLHLTRIQQEQPRTRGESQRRDPTTSSTWEQPRVRGEKESGRNPGKMPKGTTPRTRGKKILEMGKPPCEGTTPHERGKDFTTSIFSEQLSSFHSTVPSTLVQCAPQSQHLNSSRPLNH